MSAKQYLIDNINAETAKANNLKREDYVKAAKEGFAGDQAAEEGVINSTYDKAAANIQAVNDKKVSDTNTEYATQYERNAVQKLINEKQVAEKMSNLGLTDSGLNRTQQTAVQLSYANQKGKIDLAKQSALDNLALNLTSALSEIESNRSMDLLESKQRWNDKAYSVGETNYNNDLTAVNERITSAYEQYGKIAEAETDAAAKVKAAAISESAKAEKENETLLYNWKGETVLDGNGNALLKFTGSDGKSYNITPGKNPYTNSFNAKISDVVDGKCIIDKDWQVKNKNSGNAITRSCAKYGVFSNGYQPKGVCYYDDKGNVVDAGGLTSTTRKDYMNGKLQTVWFAKETKTYWIWDGTSNEYVLYEF